MHCSDTNFFKHWFNFNESFKITCFINFTLHQYFVTFEYLRRKGKKRIEGSILWLIKIWILATSSCIEELEAKKVLILKCKEILSRKCAVAKITYWRKKKLDVTLMAYCRRVPSLLQEQSERRLICVDSSNLTAKVFHLSPPTGQCLDCTSLGIVWISCLCLERVEAISKTRPVQFICCIKAVSVRCFKLLITAEQAGMRKWNGLNTCYLEEGRLPHHLPIIPPSVSLSICQLPLRLSHSPHFQPYAQNPFVEWVFPPPREQKAALFSIPGHKQQRKTYIRWRPTLIGPSPSGVSSGFRHRGAKIH